MHTKIKTAFLIGALLSMPAAHSASPECAIHIDAQPSWGLSTGNRTTQYGLAPGRSGKIYGTGEYLAMISKLRKTLLIVEQISTDGIGHPMVASVTTNMGSLYQVKIRIPQRFTIMPEAMKRLQKQARENNWKDKNNTLNFSGSIQIDDNELWPPDVEGFTHYTIDTLSLDLPLKHFKNGTGGTLNFIIESYVDSKAFLPGTYEGKFTIECVPIT